MKNQFLHLKQIRSPLSLKFLIPLVIFWLILGSVFFIVIQNIQQLETSDLNVTDDPVPAQDPENFGSERQSGQVLLPNIAPVFLILTILGILASGIYSVAVFNQPLPIKNLINESLLQYQVSDSIPARSIVFDISFGVLTLSWNKTTGTSRSWEIKLILESNYSVKSQEFAELLLMSEVLSENGLKTTNTSNTYFKIIKAQNWPQIDYLIRYWMLKLNKLE